MSGMCGRKTVRRVVLAAAGLAGACTHVSPLESYGPEAYFLSCGEMPACDRRAARLCPQGYDEIDPNIVTRLAAGLTINGPELMRNVGDLLTFRAPDGDRALFLQCRPAPQTEASDRASGSG